MRPAMKATTFSRNTVSEISQPNHFEGASPLPTTPVKQKEVVRHTRTFCVDTCYVLSTDGHTLSCGKTKRRLLATSLVVGRLTSKASRMYEKQEGNPSTLPGNFPEGAVAAIAKKLLQHLRPRASMTSHKPRYDSESMRKTQTSQHSFAFLFINRLACQAYSKQYSIGL